MGQISKSTFKKLTLLYFIGRFKKGAYSSYRVQKVFYFGTVGTATHPFSFMHTQHGQYSKPIRDDLDSLVAIGLVEKTGLENTEEDGTMWTINPEAVSSGLIALLPKIDSPLAAALDKGVDEFGYLKREDIKSRAHEDPFLKKTERGHLLFDENLPDYIEVDLSEDECEDLELSLNERFIVCMDHLVKAIETTDFNVGKVKTVDSIL